MRVLSLGLIAMLAGCVSTPGPSAAEPPPKNHRALVKAEMMARLKDPESARGLVVSELFNTGNRYYERNVWAACVRVNAKNSYGGYTGLQEYVAFFRRGSLLRIAGPGAPDTPWCRNFS